MSDTTETAEEEKARRELELKEMRALWHKEWEEAKEKTRECVQANLAALLPELKDLKFTDIRVEYEGGGDSGDYHLPIATKDDGTEVYLDWDTSYGTQSWRTGSIEVITTDKTVPYRQWHRTYPDRKVVLTTEMTNLFSAIYNQLVAAVESRHSGWYNNEGGEGTSTLILDDGPARIEVRHGLYVQETIWEEYIVALEESDHVGEQ